MEFRHQVQIYYEDTDFSGVVYHANYLKYFERAREHMLGVDELVRLYRDHGLGFAVYRCELTFREPARHGDTLEIRTTLALSSPFRLSFDQRCFRADGTGPLVKGTVELVILDAAGKLAPIPDSVVELTRRAGGPIG